MTVTPDEQLDLLQSQDLDLAACWQVIVWNDPVNLMTYVTYVFRSHFGFSQEKAQQLMLAVHHEGRAVVFTGSREEAERHTQAMHGWGLWATFEKVEG
ncbi:MAG: ATP-dependent Clp protease adapter ClpS [Rothia sp. (in: high G+C Gram-positive bacteria)]|nr:ATP-dependent Clp protease adapter ClpS [Rothia sp. (in: high G+C Gram-positive bacteria)]